MVIEIRAVLGGMTLSSIDDLSGDEVQKLTPQEVDPVDEEAPVTEAKAKAKASRPRGSRDPLVDTAPFGLEPAPPASPEAQADAEDEALFGALWPLGDVVKLDATVDRLTLRAQRDRLDRLGFAFQPLSQDWHRAGA
jgi:hypothetical protein